MKLLKRMRVSVLSVSAGVWIGTIVVFSLHILYSAAARFLKLPLPFTPDTSARIFLGNVGVGVAAFIVMVLSGTYRLFARYGLIPHRALLPVRWLVYACTLLALPAVLPVRVVSDTVSAYRKKEASGGKSALRAAATVLLIFVTVLPVWIAGYGIVWFSARTMLGYSEQPLRISGTGSMYPTFPKGEGKDPKSLSKQVVGTPGMLPYPNGLVILGKRFFGYGIGRGDIVALEDKTTRDLTMKTYGDPSGWIKRVIGVAGDTIELRDGIVYRNGARIREPYTAEPHSTFGESFLGECRKVTVPKDSVFVMGDNRKGSGDSREVGFFPVSSINHVLPFASQKGVLDRRWRDTTNDFSENSKIRLDRDRYLELLNNKRKEAGVRPLTYQPKLEASSKKRGEVILKYDDFSFAATKSGYTMQRAMSDVGYSNVVWGEAPTQGYYSADELLDNQFEFPASKKFLLDRQYQEVGIAEAEGEINGCPTQIIVQQYAGYVPPNYSSEVVSSWAEALKKLKEVQPGWSNLKNVFSIYDAHKDEVNRINDIIALRIANMEGIVSRMQNNQWLTDAQNAYTERDKALSDEQESLAKKLNSY